MKIWQEKGIFLICMYGIIIGICFVVIGICNFNNMTENTLSQENVGVFTAYTASVCETDSDPMITASNKKVREGIVANNCLPFGTKIIVNDRIYEVQDRMNERYGCDNFDIYMCDYSDAISFGRQTLPYEFI